MIHTKKTIADRVISRLQNDFPGIDFKIQIREVFLVVDDIVNAMAKKNHMDNWKLGSVGLDECFITTWDGDNALTVVEEDNTQSYLTLPATPAALFMNGGIVEIWPLNFEFGAVKIRRHEDIRRTRNLMSGNMQGELGGYPRGTLFVFDQIDVRKNFSENFGCRLAIKDSTAISETAPYPVAGDLLEEVIGKAYLYFAEKRLAPTDTVRDKNDKA